jgi:hypothetical protein
MDKMILMMRMCIDRSIAGGQFVEQEEYGQWEL